MKGFGRRLFLFFSSYTFHVAGTVFAAQLQVPATHATISAAVTAANPSDTIVVAAGTYNDLGTLDITKSLTLRGPNFAISPNTGSRLAEARITGVAGLRIKSNVSNVTIEGLSFENISGTGNGVIENQGAKSNNILIQKNRIVDITNVSGVYGSGNKATGWYVIDNFISGIALPNMNSVLDFSRVENVVITDNVVSSTSGQGISLQNNDGITILRNDISGAAQSGIVLGGTWNNADIRNNTVNGCQNGLTITNGDLSVNVISIAGNSFSSNANKAILHQGSGLLDASLNWFGDTDPAGFTSSLSGPVDYSPWFNSGSDTQATTPGFQGDYSFLNVDVNSPVAGDVLHLNEVGSLITPGGTVHIWPGTYAESVAVGFNLTVLATGSPRVQAAALENNAIVSLFGDVEIYDNLLLASGTVNTDTSTITVSNDSPSAVSILNGSIVGKIQRVIGAGSGAKYHFTDSKTSITPNGSQGTVDVLVESRPGMPPPVAMGNSIDRHFMISPSAPLSGTVELSYLDSELNSISEEDLGAFNYVGSTWYNHVGVVDTAQNMISVSGVSTWNLWTLGDMNAPLPIQLAHFSAVVLSGTMNVSLTWGTVTETNNFGFLIQQCQENQATFIDVPNSFVPGHGTTVNPQEYSWIHAGVSPGRYWYRLKQIDFDGTVSFTEAQEVIVDAPTSVDEKELPHIFALEQNYPNPFNPTTTIRFSVERTGPASVVLFNPLGQEMLTLFSGQAQAGQNYSLQVNASQLSSGIYFYRLESGGTSASRRMLLLK